MFRFAWFCVPRIAGVLLLLLSGTNVMAHGAHGDDKGPNGGYIIHTDYGHYEVVVSEDLVDVFATDSSGKPFNRDAVLFQANQILDNQAVSTEMEFIPPNTRRVIINPALKPEALLFRLDKDGVMVDLVRIELSE